MSSSPPDSADSAPGANPPSGDSEGGVGDGAEVVTPAPEGAEPPPLPGSVPPRILRLLAPALSVLAFPGIGHALVGRPLRGMAWLGSLVLAAAGFVGLARLGPRWLVGLPLVWLVLVAVTAGDAWVVARHPRKTRIWGWVGYVLAAGATFVLCTVGLALLLRWYVLESFTLRQGGMCPTLMAGDKVFVDKAYYAREPLGLGDIVVYDHPSDSRVAMMHRVVGLAGDTLVVTETGRLVRNGTLVEARDLREIGCDDEPLAEERLGGTHRVALHPGGRAAGPFTVGPGEFFAAADDRGPALDSRSYGPVAVSAVRGKVVWRWSHRGALTWERVQ